jgi:Uma2 family endonuclease
MERKREDFFAAGTELFWIVYPDRREVEASTSPESHQVLGVNDTLDGGAVLPGFSLSIKEYFASADIKGDGPKA